MAIPELSIPVMDANQVVLISHEVLRQGTPEEVLQSPEFARAFHRKGAMEP